MAIEVSDSFLDHIYVLDSNYQKKIVIDVFSDILWVERYCGCGEFEITMPVNLNIIENCHLDDYVMIRESDKIMIIESIGIYSDPENGDKIVMNGRSLESILDRRTSLSSYSNITNFQSLIQKIITDTIVNPSTGSRKIPNFTFKSSSDTAITLLTVDATDRTGENVYELITDLCQSKNVGYRVSPSGSGGFEFELYSGADRTWNQSTLLPVVFSDSYENLQNSNYIQSRKTYKTTVYINNDGSTYTVHRGTEQSGLARREMYSKDTEVKNQSQANTKGAEILKDYTDFPIFDADMSPNGQFIYGTDYFIGDVVQVQNKYGQKGRCRITEIVMSRDGSGSEFTPTFEIVDE